MHFTKARARELCREQFQLHHEIIKITIGSQLRARCDSERIVNAHTYTTGVTSLCTSLALLLLLTITYNIFPGRPVIIRTSINSHVILTIH